MCKNQVGILAALKEEFGQLRRFEFFSPWSSTTKCIFGLKRSRTIDLNSRTKVACLQENQPGWVLPLTGKGIFRQWIAGVAEPLAEWLVAARLNDRPGGIGELPHAAQRLRLVVLRAHDVLLPDTAQAVEVGVAPVAQYLGYGIVKVQDVAGGYPPVVC